MGTTGGLLTFVEVRDSGRPAFFYDYGEALVYRRGEIFDLHDWGPCLSSGVTPAPLPAVILESPVGIEYGWRHAEACDCRLCRNAGVGSGRRKRADLAKRGGHQARAGRPRPGSVAASPEL